MGSYGAGIKSKIDRKAKLRRNPQTKMSGSADGVSAGGCGILCGMEHVTHSQPTPEIAWSVGRTLNTKQTRGWTAEEIAANDRVESTMVFSNFTASDQGRSRNKIAICVGDNATAHAARIVRCVNSHAALVDALEKSQIAFMNIARLARFESKRSLEAVAQLRRCEERNAAVLNLAKEG